MSMRLNAPGRMQAIVIAQTLVMQAAELENMVRYEHPFVQDEVHQLRMIARQVVTNLTVYAEEPEKR